MTPAVPQARKSELCSTTVTYTHLLFGKRRRKNSSAPRFPWRAPGQPSVRRAETGTKVGLEAWSATPRPQAEGCRLPGGHRLEGIFLLGERGRRRIFKKTSQKALSAKTGLFVQGYKDPHSPCLPAGASLHCRACFGDRREDTEGLLGISVCLQMAWKKGKLEGKGSLGKKHQATPGNPNQDRTGPSQQWHDGQCSGTEPQNQREKTRPKGDIAPPSPQNRVILSLSPWSYPNIFSHDSSHQERELEQRRLKK